MNSRLRQKFIKNLIAAVLLSDMSESEIMELSDEFADGGLSQELASILQGDLFPLSKSLEVNIKSTGGNIVAQALNITKRRKLTRRTIQNYMSMASPSLSRKYFMVEVPIKNLLERYFKAVTPNEGATFLSLLNDDEPDPYLKGITNRSRS